MPPKKVESVSESKLSEWKFVVQPILARFENGQLVGEVQIDPIVVYKVDGLLKFCDGFHEDLQRLNDQLAAENNGA